MYLGNSLDRGEEQNYVLLVLFGAQSKVHRSPGDVMSLDKDVFKRFLSESPRIVSNSIQKVLSFRGVMTDSCVLL